MAQNRIAAVQNKNYPNTWEPNLSLINEVLSEVYKVFSFVFADGKTKPAGTAGHKSALLHEIWQYLASSPQFDSLKELNQFYAQLIDNLEEYIADYCMRAHFPRENISQNRKNMLLQLLQLYTALANQKFILLQFKAGDEAEKFAHEFSFIQNKFNTAENKFVLDRNQIRDMNARLDQITSILIRAFKTRNYPLAIENEIGNDNIKLNNSLFPNLVKQQLACLPKIVLLNATMDGIQKAVIEENKSAIKYYKIELQKLIKILEEIKAQLNELIPENLVYYFKFLDCLLAESDLLNKKLDLFKEHPRLFKVTNLLKEMVGEGEEEDGFVDIKTVTDKLIEECNWQARTEKLSLGFGEKGSSLIANAFKHYLPKVVTQLDKFKEEYSSQLPELDKFSLNVKKMQAEKREIDQLHKQLTEKLRKLQEVLLTCIKTITVVQEVLASYTHTPGSFLKNFFVDHWLKMSVGAAVGGGASTLLALLTLSNPLSWMVLVTSGAIIGTSLGASAGLATDTLHEKAKNSDKKPGRKQPESSKRTTRSQTSIPFWKRSKSSVCQKRHGKETAHSYHPK